MNQPKPLVLGDVPLTLADIVSVARQGRTVEIGPAARDRMNATRRVVDAVVKLGDDAPAIYAINTGFGGLARVRISPNQVRELQRNLVLSHAAGVGEPLPEDAVRAMILLRAAVLSTGYAGARPEMCEVLCELLTHRITPVIPRRGSVGASGDLAPLAHLALTLIGEGAVDYKGERMPAKQALADAGIAPVILEAKEGLSLINGTQHMTAVGALVVHDAIETAHMADICGAMSLEALRGTPRAFDARIVGARPHPGQCASAALLRDLLDDSEIIESHRDCDRVQDAYSLRCMPQVHGASRDLLDFARTVIEREANSCTDNPLIFLDEQFAEGGELISGGNFHGQPVAQALDVAAIGLAEIGNISERRIEQMVNPHYSSGLPPFLVPESGLHSGFMAAQYSAAALVSENKVLCHPASVDSIPTSAGREDHVSMGPAAALKLAKIHDHVRTVLAIELLAAAQGVDLRAPHKPGRPLRPLHARVREVVPFMDADRPIHEDIRAVRSLIDDGTVLATLDKEAAQ